MKTSAGCRPPWQAALLQKSVWKNAAAFGLTVGILQAGINQGDYWVRHAVTGVILVKTLACPLVSFSVAFASSACTWISHQQEKLEYEKA